MGITIDQGAARVVLADAIDWAESDRAVPDVWIDWTQRIDACPSKTFTVAFGTALLAKATNPMIDALALKFETSEAAYSARTLAHGVLVPLARYYGYNLRATGREPLNNQPFFRYDRIDGIERIHKRAEPFLPVLIDACNAINRLDKPAALGALAAFLRVRLEAARSERPATLTGSGVSMADLITKTQNFIDENPEGGRRGQAFVAAALDLVFDDVHNGRVNDPSRRLPGDVQALADGQALVGVEVRQKGVSHSEALQFAESLQTKGVGVGMIALLDPSQADLDADAVLADAEAQHGVLLVLTYGVFEVLTQAAAWSGQALDVILEGFPRHMLARLQEIEAAPESCQRWADLFD